MLIHATSSSLELARRIAVGQIDRLKERLSAHRAARRLRQAIISLNDQDDFVLLDLGIRRDQIAEVVHHGRPDQDPRHLWRSRD